jgi:hypothetical protein
VVVDDEDDEEVVVTVESSSADTVIDADTVGISPVLDEEPPPRPTAAA